METIHYIVPETITNPAVRSQAISIATTIQNSLDKSVVYYGLYKNNDQNLIHQTTEIQTYLAEKGVSVKLYPNKRGSGLFSTIRVLINIVSDVRRTWAAQPGPILARRLIGAWLAYISTRGLRTAQYSVDLRSHAGAELEISGWMRSGTLKSGLFHLWEKLLLKRAASILCVSQPLADYVREITKETTPCFVVPSCLDSTVEAELEETLRVSGSVEKGNGLVLAYAGTITNWNNIDPMLVFFKRSIALWPEIKFLFITTHLEQAQAAFNEYLIPDEKYKLICLPHSDVIDYLRKADVGLLLRDASLLNKVASPIKAAEYLAAGLPLIVTDNIGDLSKTVRKEQVGLVLPSVSPETWNDRALCTFLQNLIAQKASFRKRAVLTSRKYFLRQNYLDTYKNALFGNYS